MLFGRGISGAHCPASPSKYYCPQHWVMSAVGLCSRSWKLPSVSTSSMGTLLQCCTMLLVLFLLMFSLKLPTHNSWILSLVPSATLEESFALHFCICPSESCRLLLGRSFIFSLSNYAASTSFRGTCTVGMRIHLPSSNIKVILNILLTTSCYWQNCQ